LSLRNTSLNCFPKTRFVKHTYVDNVTLPAASGPGYGREYVFRANSTYDPDFTGVGHQPMYRDQMAAAYQKYLVMYSIIKVTYQQTTNTQINSQLYVSNDFSLDKTYPLVTLEQYNTGVPGIPSVRNLPLVKKAFFHAPKWYKTTRRGILADDTYRTSPGNNPNNGVYFIIYQAPVDATVTLAATIVQVHITMFCYWFDPFDATGS